MADGFDVDAVVIVNERGVIVGMIMRPDARRAIVSAAGGQSRLVEGIARQRRKNFPLFRERDG